MADKALRGNKLTRAGKRAGKSLKKKPIMTFEQEVNAGSLEALGIYHSGGTEGKPHSTKEGRLSAGRNWYNRAWGQKHFNKKKKGIPV